MSLSDRRNHGFWHAPAWIAGLCLFSSLLAQKAAEPRLFHRLRGSDPAYKSIPTEPARSGMRLGRHPRSSACVPASPCETTRPVRRTALSLPQAVRLAVRQYPESQAARQASAASRNGLRLARLAYLPQLEIYGQINRATDNNLGGLLFANPLPALSGPVTAFSPASYWGSTGGATIAWEPYGFGRRRAGIARARDAARSAFERSRLARLRAGMGAASAYLAVLSAEQGLRVSRSDVRRWKSVDRIVHALVQAQLRPAGDAARVDAELSAVRIEAVRAAEAFSQERDLLAESLGMAQARLTLNPGRLASRLPAATKSPMLPNLRQHPDYRAAVANLAAAQAHRREASRQGMPRLYLLGAATVRRSRSVTPATGLFMPEANAANWAAGAAVRFSISGWLRARRRARIASDLTREQQARTNGVEQQLEYAERNVRAAWQSAWRTAHITPAELASARTGEADARARYQAGLSNVVDLVNAEQVLSQALASNAQARLRVWQVLLRQDYLRGHLRPYLNSVAGAYPGGRP